MGDLRSAIEAAKDHARALADRDAEITTLRERCDRQQKAIDSLTLWLLHRFGPDTPEGREANCARAALGGAHG